ncbi:hypothetical protein IW252_001776 [Zhihengliuella flava]|uniref:Uncharacterized protein n=1 Tax=Zhihengliuella flava TaxID=1285193 RepID=A0A931GM28_9MICC|nr:hypothetical protein [Zhihengliuella flava]
MGHRVTSPRDVGQPAVEVDGVFPRVAPEQLGAPGVRGEQSQQDADGGGFAGAVGTEEAVHLAGVHVEVEAVEGADAAKVFGHVGEVDEGGHARSCAVGDGSLGSPGAGALAT